MLQKITNLFIQLVQSYLFLIVLALGVGLLFPGKAIVLAPLATLFLQIIFFLTSLKMDSQKVLRVNSHWRMVLSATVFMLILLPILVFFMAKILVPDFAIALLLLAAMPTGMTVPLLSEVVGTEPETALVLTLTTSLLAPITIPLVIGLFAHTAVTVSFLTMFWSLVKVIVIPFVLAQGVRHIWKRQINATAFTFKPISLILLGLLIAGVVAKQADVILQGFGTTLIMQLAVLFVFVAALLAGGYFVAFWRPCDERVTTSLSVTFMNFTLAIYLAGSFFADPTVLLASVLIIFPWTLLLLPYKYLIRKFVCKLK